MPMLLETPAAVRFVSVEPMLGPVDFTRVKWAKIPVDPANYARHGVPAPDEMWSLNNVLVSRPADDYNKAKIGLDWVIVGGESGPGARPMHPGWARSIRDQCQAAGVSFYFKQWGEWKHVMDNHEPGRVLFERVGKKAAGRLLDGREWNEYPEINP